MRKISTVFMTALIAIFFMSQIAVADIYMKQKKHVGAISFMGQNRPAEDSVEEIWITDTGFRTDDPKNSIILLFDDKKMIMLDHEEKTFMEVPMDFEEISKKMKEGQSEEENQAMQGMMQNMMKVEAAVEVTDEKQKINNWNCRKYIMTMKTFMGVMTREIWATEDIEIDEEIYTKFSTSMISAMPGMQNAMGSVMKEMDKIKGIHVKSSMEQQVMNQTVKSSTELLEYKKGTAPSDLFDLPKGYKKKSM